MSPKNPLQKRAQQIFKTYVTPAFQKAGFTKQGVTYLRHLNQIVHIVDIQQSPTNRVYEISFALNCGVYIPGVKAALWKGPEPTKLIAADGLFDVRPGSLLPVAGKSWWDLKSTDEPGVDAAVGGEILDILETALLPFFDRFRSESAIAEFLSQPRKKEDKHISPMCESLCYAYGGIIWNKLGECEKCRAAMAQVVVEAGTKRLEARNALFAKNFVCDGKPKAGTS